jgi:hypothetical protein
MNAMQIQLQLQLNKLILTKNKHTIHKTVTVIEYVMSWTDAPTFHHDLPCIPRHNTYTPFTSSPQFTSLHSPSLHFTSLHLEVGIREQKYEWHAYLQMDANKYMK